MALDELRLLTSDQSCVHAISAPNHVLSSTTCHKIATAYTKYVRLTFINIELLFNLKKKKL